MKYIKRQIEISLTQAIKEFPVIVLTGPRQTGKTTVIKHLFPKYNYVTMDDISKRIQATNDPQLFLDNLGNKVIIDEIQYVPDLLPYVKMRIDKRNSASGLYILTGSQVFPLMSGISESLAGRVCLFELLGFSWKELNDDKEHSLKYFFKTIFNGFYPRPTVQKINISNFYSSYLQTYIERDIRQIKMVHDIVRFQMFLELLAARTGSLLNLNEVAKECAISQSTAIQWLSLLESTRIIYLLRPYFKNISKRVIKSPKLYFTDTGLLTNILKYQDPATLLSGPMAGHFFENMIIMDLLKYKFNTQSLSNFYFFRDSNHNEIDLIIDKGNTIIPVEIKMRKTYLEKQINFLKKIDAIIPNCKNKYISSMLNENIQLSKNIFNIPWWKLSDLV